VDEIACAGVLAPVNFYCSLGFTSASSDHIFGIILYPLHVKSKMWSEPHFQGFLVNSTIFTLRRLRILE
jgi:hypothetical protein